MKNISPRHIYKKIQWFKSKNSNSLLLKLINKTLLGKKIFDFVAFRTPDIHVISFPKSGRTWLRMILIYYLMYEHNVESECCSKLLMAIHIQNPTIPFIGFSHDEILAGQKRKINPKIYQNKKIVLLIREIKDVLVSFYHHMTSTLSRLIM